MRARNSAFYTRERKLVAEKRPLLPTHAGEARYQMALDRDRKYREMILGVFALCLFSASGFGQISAAAGPVRGALLCLAMAGFALRATVRRLVPAAGGESIVEGPAMRLVLGTLLAFGVLGSVRSGLSGLPAMSVVLAVIGLVAGTAAWSSLRRSEGGGGEETASRTAILLTSLAALGWVAMTLAEATPWPWNVPASALGCVAVVLLQRLLSTRSSFAPVVATLILVHLSSFLDAAPNLEKLVVPQVAVLLLEFCLLNMSGYRQAIASLARYPIATYRSSPQCLVPSLDHAWDHPLKIDAI